MYYQVTYSSELYHHGIKGMKWGERRYQNEDGSYTDAGRKRYGLGERYALYKGQKYGKKARKYDEKYKKARFNFTKRYYAYNAAGYKQRQQHAKDYAEANNVKSKLSALSGARALNRNWNVMSEYEDRVAKTYKEGSKKRIRQERKASNTKAIAEAWKRVDENNASVQTVLSTPIQNVRNGKQTTYGKEVAKSIALDILLKSI